MIMIWWLLEVDLEVWLVPRKPLLKAPKLLF